MKTASYTLGPLNNTNYVAPPKGTALDCECNTVMYSYVPVPLRSYCFTRAVRLMTRFTV